MEPFNGPNKRPRLREEGGSIAKNDKTTTITPGNVMMQNVIVVTGGTSGIGKALVEYFVKENQKVATFGSSNVKVLKLREQFGNYKDIFIDRVDLNCKDEISGFFHNVDAKLGKISVLINNAAVTGPLVPIGEARTEEVYETISVNLTAPIFLASRVVCQMLDFRIPGIIINVTSGAAAGIQGAALYAAGKGGLDSFSASLAKDYHEGGIFAFSFNPGHVDTPMQEKVRSADPEKFRAAVFFKDLKSEEKLISPQRIAQLIAFVIANPEKFPNGSIINHSQVDEAILTDVQPPSKTL